MVKFTFRSEEGFVLAVVLTFTLILTIIGMSFLNMGGQERIQVRHEADYRKAFYLAEAGLQRALYDLKQDFVNDTTDPSWADGNINNVPDDTTTVGPNNDIFYDLPYTSTSLAGGNYTVKLKNVDDGAGGSLNDEIWVKSEGTFKDITRTVQVKAEQSGNSNDVTSAIETAGTVSVGGSATITGGTPTIKEGSATSFNDVFGMSKAQMESRATNHYTDPASNAISVTNITWVNLTGENECKIASAEWAGSGILVVNGDLKITGGTFSGVIWVIGELTMITGDPGINGGIFVEGGTEVTTQVTGDATITYDASAINDAFNNSLFITQSWHEVS